MATIEELVSKDLNEINIFTTLREHGERLRRLEEYSGGYHEVTQVTGDVDVLKDLDIIAGNGLIGGGNLTADVTISLGTPGTLSVSSSDGVTDTSHTHAITTSANPGAATSILASDASGYLQLVRLGLDVSPTSSLHIRSGSTPQLRLEYNASETAYLQTSGSGDLRLYSSGNLELYPDGNIQVNPVGKYVSPVANYDVNLGALNKKYLTLHAAELWVETLVAQNTIATIGGRVLVGSTTVLEADFGSAATTMSVKHNQMAIGDVVYMEASGKVEFMAVLSGPTGSDPYSYVVERNLDGSGANDWFAGDAVFNTGQVGDGFIDLYSVSGVVASSSAGPTIVGNVRYDANLVLNPGFETAGTGGFADWTEVFYGDLLDQHSPGYVGAYCCRNSSWGTANYIYQDITVTASTDYTLSFYYADDGYAKASYRIYDVSNAGDIVSWTNVKFQAGATWRHQVQQLTTPVGCTSVRIYLRGPVNYTAYFDEVVLQQSWPNNWIEHWAIGNLNGLYGVGSNVYGVGLGRPDKAYVQIDDTDGVTIRDSIGTKLIQLDVSGNVIFGNVATGEANVFWNSVSNRLEFRGGASGTTVQAYIDTDGAFVAGSITDRDVVLNQSGLTLIAQPQGYVTGGKSIDFYSTTDSVNLAMITVTRYSVGGDNYSYLILQATDDLSHGVNYSGHSNPVLAVGYDQYGGNYGKVSVGNAAFVVGSRSFSDIAPAVAGRIYTEGIIDAGGDVLSDGNIVADLDLKTWGGLAVGQPGDNPGQGEIRAYGHIKTDQGIYVGGRTGATGTGEVRATSHIRCDGGMYIGSKTGGTSSGNLNMSGKIESSNAVGCTVYRTSNYAVPTGAYQTITWQAEEWDSDGMFTASSTAIYFKRTGRYFVWFNCQMIVDWVTDAFNWAIQIVPNATTNILYWDKYDSQGFAAATVAGIVNCTAVNQYVQAQVYHNRGSTWNLSTASRFGAIRIP